MEKMYMSALVIECQKKQQEMIMNYGIDQYSWPIDIMNEYLNLEKIIYENRTQKKALTYQKQTLRWAKLSKIIDPITDWLTQAIIRIFVTPIFIIINFFN